MTQPVRLMALLAIVYVAFSVLGKGTSIAALDGTDGACTARSHGQAIDLAVDAVDYAGAVLIANGEPFRGQSVDEIRAEIMALPAYDESDGLTEEELLALDRLLEHGRQLSFALATRDLNRLIEDGPGDIRLASAGKGIDFEVLEALRGGC